MNISFFGKSDVGKVRYTNEDYFTNEKINDKEYIFIIADGMGGHQAGEVASRLGTTTFVNEYKKLRKKGKTIKDSMIQSLKKANSIILKRAISDPQKRGMGTTFTGCVISDNKVTIIHVGDSRIYFIRNNKIKKLTTDHTFVEKMLNEGKITEEEARDHPQKNILYMSLGARESYVPEIINNLTIKNGDIITMCSDGLNNMVDDGSIKEYSQAYNPEKSVKELIKLANENGGIDNITIQIIHAGRNVNKNKTQPIKKIKSKRKRMALSFIIGILFLIFFFWIDWNGKYSKSAQINNPFFKNIFVLLSLILKNDNTSPIDKNILKIQSFKNQKKILSPTYFFSLSQNTLLIKKNNKLYLFDTNQSKLINKKSLNPHEQIIPTNLKNFSSSGKSNLPTTSRHVSLDSFYILKKIGSKTLKYKIIPLIKNTTLLTIQSDEELNSINHESRIVKFTNMIPPITPIYIDERAFIFNDKHKYYVIENPISERRGELGFYKISNLSYHPAVILTIKATENDLNILYFNYLTKILNVFEITRSKWISSQKILVHFPEKPLSIEYYNPSTIIFYFSTQYIIFKKGYRIAQSTYSHKDKDLLIKTVMIDPTENQRILSDANRCIFKLNLIHND